MRVAIFGPVVIYGETETIIRASLLNISLTLLDPQVYRSLQGGKGTGVPVCRFFGSEGKYNVMVTDLLGPCLEDLFNKCNRRFSPLCVMMLAEQLVDRIQYVHQKNFIHRDIKPVCDG